MSETSSEVRRVAWDEVLAFTRLFRTPLRALHLTRLSLGFACVVCCYLVGRLLDAAWVGAGAGVLPGDVSSGRSEIVAFATLDRDTYDSWRELDRRQVRGMEHALVVRHGADMDAAKAAEALRSRSASSLLRTSAARDEVNRAIQTVDERARSAIAALRSDTARPADERDAELRRVRRAADSLRVVLRGGDLRQFSPAERSGAVEALLSADGSLAPAERAETAATLARVVGREQGLAELQARAPRGVWISQVDYQMNCFAGAVQGVVALRWGWGGGAFDPQPSLLGSLGSSASGALWLLTERPWYAVIYGLLHALIFAFFGTAICRSAALQSARPDAVPSASLVAFARDKTPAGFFALIAPGLLMVGIAAVMFLGAVVAGLPGIGPIIGGLTFVLALLGGLALALVLAAAVLGTHLFVPTIAAEGSDAFDALQHGAGYVVQRPWLVGFYSLLLLLCGGVAFVVLRMVLLMMLKLTHAVSWAGMSWFGAWSSARTDSFSRLDAIWTMPAWSELSLLPTVGGQPFWGLFAVAPLSAPESFAWFFMALWVFLFVAVLGGFVVSFYFCGSTEMYFLLRRSVDGMDYDEVYYEEDEEAFFAAAASNESRAESSPEPGTRGTPLPVMGTPPSTT